MYPRVVFLIPLCISRRVPLSSLLVEYLLRVFEFKVDLDDAPFCAKVKLDHICILGILILENRFISPDPNAEVYITYTIPATRRNRRALSLHCAFLCATSATFVTLLFREYTSRGERRLESQRIYFMERSVTETVQRRGN
jgi:hypothetical protein